MQGGGVLEVKIGKFGWRQIGGDMNPSQHGATIAKGDGSALELRKIQPTREYVGDGEALEVGFPFWSRDGYFTIDDLDPAQNPQLVSAMNSSGLTYETLAEIAKPEERALALAEALLDHGSGDEGPAGWSKDVVPGRVHWWGSKRAVGSSYLADEDREFRQLQRENR